MDRRDGIRVHRVARLAMILGVVALALPILLMGWVWVSEGQGPPAALFWVTCFSALAIGIASLNRTSAARRGMMGEDASTLNLLAFATVAACLALGVSIFLLLIGLQACCS